MSGAVRAWARLAALSALCTVCALRAEAGGHTFYREMRAAGTEGTGAGGGTRRVFGGRAAPLETYGAVCALVDRWWAARCSGAVVAARWALTAAHCVTPRLAYVKYNARRPAAAEGALAQVHYLYRHPGYRTNAPAAGGDVTLLHHDVGLVRTRTDMALEAPPALAPLRAMRLYDAGELRGNDVQVLGFGRTERAALGEELSEVRLRLAPCERSTWFHCVCAVAPPAPAEGAEGAKRAGDKGSEGGVCSGDSGGPVLYRGAQVGVTSMGPLECGSQDGQAAPTEGSTSVVTSLYQYADLINATLHDTDAALRMSVVGAASTQHDTLLALVLYGTHVMLALL